MNVSSLAREMLVRWATRGVMFLGVVIALSQVGLELGPVLAGVGVAGFIVGFALQDTLSNFAAGVMILVYRPFDDGDSVEVAGVAGKVDNMSLVSTTILSSDNQLIVVPNSKIWGDVIRNVTAMGTRRIDLVFGISYEDDIETAERLLGEIVTAHEKVLEEPAPRVKVSKLSESSVDFIVRPWCRTEDYWDVYWDITRTVKMRFDEEGISFPFPHDVHVLELRQGEGSGSGVAAGRKKVLAAEVSDN
jgi:small conductance mechanosensitive channel